MGADSVSRGAWLLPPSVGRHAKAAVDDYRARPLRCATGSDPSSFRSLPASRLARTGLIELLPRWLVARMLPISAYMIVTRGAVALWAMPLDRAGRFRKRIAIVGGGARPRQPFIYPDLLLASTSSGCSTIASMTGVPNPYALTTSSARIASSPFCA